MTLLRTASVALLTSCGTTPLAVGAFPSSNAHIANAGSGATRAGFGVHALYSPDGSDGNGAAMLPLVQGVGGVDIGTHYALHAVATSTALGVDGVVLAVNQPGIRVGIVHGVSGAFSRVEFGDTYSGGFGVGPSLSIGSGVRGFAVVRYEGLAGRTKLRNPLSRPAENSALATAVSGSLGVSLDGAIRPVIELGFRNPVSSDTSDGLLLTLGISFIAELPQ